MSSNLMLIGAIGDSINMVGVWILLGASVIFVVNSVNMDSDLRYQSGALYQYLMSWWAR